MEYSECFSPPTSEKSDKESRQSYRLKLADVWSQHRLTQHSTVDYTSRFDGTRVALSHFLRHHVVPQMKVTDLKFS